MKKILVMLLAMTLSGCFLGDDDSDSYSKKKSLTPVEVNALHEVCKSQPGYDISWVVTVHSEAKGVICRYRDLGVSRLGERGRSYTMDAEVLKIKINEGLR